MMENDLVMEISRRPLYNSLRMNWILDPTLEVAPWQVEDYRSLPLDVLFERLGNLGLHLDKVSFKAFAEATDSPEDLTDEFLAEFPEDVQTKDKAYLVIFELWRRLLPEKQSLSVFCDELDHQIYLYDRKQAVNAEEIQDTLASLQDILDENVDNGAEPQEAFAYVEAGCANDIEMFLRDFILDQLDNDNYSYAAELLDGFGDYLRDERWAEFLKARALEESDRDEAVTIVEGLIDEDSDDSDIDLDLEIIGFLVRHGERPLFEKLAKKTAKSIDIEDDFLSLVSLSADFFHRIDKEKNEEALLKLLKKREDRPFVEKFDSRDPHLAEFLKIISA